MFGSWTPLTQKKLRLWPYFATQQQQQLGSTTAYHQRIVGLYAGGAPCRSGGGFLCPLQPQRGLLNSRRVCGGCQPVKAAFQTQLTVNVTAEQSQWNKSCQPGIQVWVTAQTACCQQRLNGYEKRHEHCKSVRIFNLSFKVLTVKPRFKRLRFKRNPDLIE